MNRFLCFSFSSSFAWDSSKTINIVGDRIMLNVVVGGARRRRRTWEKKKRFYSTCAIDRSIFSLPCFSTRYTIPNEAEKKGNHTQPACGEQKIKSISSLYHSRVSSMRKAHVFYDVAFDPSYRFIQSCFLLKLKDFPSVEWFFLLSVEDKSRSWRKSIR